MQSESLNTYNPSLSLVSQLTISTNASSNSNPQQPNIYQNSGVTSVAIMDDLVKEYLLFRGFNSCLKSLEQDLKQDKDKCLKADKVIEQLFAFIYSFDLNGLMDYWIYLDNKYFSRLTLKFVQNTSSSITLTRKYELFLLRYYLIHAIQSSKPEKASELFENYAYKLQSQAEWKEWYCLPFLRNPEDNPTFSVYFSKNWIDTFIISLQNFLNIIFQSVQYPRLLNHDEDTFGNTMKQGIPKTPNQFKSSNVFSFEQDFLQKDLNDEFQLLQNDHQSKPPNSLISMLKNLTYSKVKQGIKSPPPAGNPNILNDQNSFNRPPEQTNKLLPLINRKLTIDSTSKNLRRNSSARSNSTLINSLKPTAILENESSKNNLTDNYEEKLSDTIRKQTIKSLSTNETVLENPIKNIERVNPYLLLSQDDYLEHKSHILHCKFSKDGKHIASVDAQGVIKIWSPDNTTINTLMQKSLIVSIEWDKRTHKVLYFGTQTSIVKLYDIFQKKIIQEVVFNKMFPIITNICSEASNGRLLIMMTVKTNQTRPDLLKNSQMAICNTNGLNNNLIIEKVIDFEAFFCQCSIVLDNYFILGCSDGHLRVYDNEIGKICQVQKSHENNILNIVINKDHDKFFTISADQRIKIWKFDASKTIKLDQIDSLKIQLNTNPNENQTTPTFTSSLLSVIRHQNDFDPKNFSYSTVVAFDNSESFFFLLNKTGAFLNEILDCSEEVRDELGDVECERINSFYELENPTTVEIWNASTSCILLVGSSSGLIRVFKLLHQL